MHDKAISQIKRKVEGNLKNCRIENKWPVHESIAPHIQSLATEVLKSKSEWLTNQDVVSIFYDLVYEAIEGEDNSYGTGSRSVWDALGEERAVRLKNELVDYYLSVPRTYNIYLPLPSLSVNGVDFAFNGSRLAIVSYENSSDIPGGYFGGGLLGYGQQQTFDIRKAFLQYSVQGYCSWDFQNKTIQKAFSAFKLILQQGISKNLFQIKKDTPTGLGYLGLMRSGSGNSDSRISGSLAS